MRYIKKNWFILVIIMISSGSVVGSILWSTNYTGNSPVIPENGTITDHIIDPIYNKGTIDQSVIKLEDISTSNIMASPSGSGIIEGRGFEDLNANGIKDSDEVVLAGWQIKLQGPVSLTTTTGSDGRYSFFGLPAGNYTISEVLPQDWVQTAPLFIVYNITITTGSDIIGRNFGNFHKGEISGRVSTSRAGSITEGGGRIVGQNFKLKFRIHGEWPTGICPCIAKGNLEYQDQSTKLILKSIQINTVATTLDKKRGVITGLVKINGKGSYPFVTYIEKDLQADIFYISLPTFPYSNRILVSGGSVEIRK